MKRILCNMLLIASLSWSAAALADGQNARFFSTLSDVPLMDGLNEVPGQGASFDKPEGRIVEVSAVAPKNADPESIRTFYKASLPQFGWQPAGADTYARDRETLTMRIGPENGFPVVHFMVAPR